jgi:hypothetical protein
MVGTEVYGDLRRRICCFPPIHECLTHRWPPVFPEQVQFTTKGRACGAISYHQLLIKV